MARLLLISTDNAVAGLARALHSDHGHHTVLVASAAQALELLRPGGFDIVVVDGELPRRQAVALVAALRASSTYKGVPVIGLVGVDVTADGLLTVGAERVVKKPVDGPGFSRSLESVLCQAARAANPDPG
ncbi:MAG: Fis family transcriptional regulator [Cyanobacteria bacterium RYN_339]|nr:Fis family transcriptional regulator [Cyanobacteria bacterium RYN_339]